MTNIPTCRECGSGKLSIRRFVLNNRSEATGEVTITSTFTETECRDCGWMTLMEPLQSTHSFER